MRVADRFLKVTLLIFLISLFAIAIQVLPTQSSSIDSKKGIMILVDNSGSLGDTPGGGRDIPTATAWLRHIKNTTQQHYVGNPTLKNIDMGLIQFGGQCDTVELAKIGSPKAKITKDLDTISPYPHLKANTPILLSISDAVNALSKKVEPKIVLFSDLGENCTPIDGKQCTLVQRIESDLSKQRIPLTIAMVGYSARSGLSTAGSAASVLDCFPEGSKLIKFGFFNGGNNLNSLDRATKASLDFLGFADSSEAASTNILAIFLTAIGNFLNGIGGLLSGLAALVVALLTVCNKCKKDRKGGLQ